MHSDQNRQYEELGSLIDDAIRMFETLNLAEAKDWIEEAKETLDDHRAARTLYKRGIGSVQH